MIPEREIFFREHESSETENLGSYQRAERVTNSLLHMTRKEFQKSGKLLDELLEFSEPRMVFLFQRLVLIRSETGRSPKFKPAIDQVRKVYQEKLGSPLLDRLIALLELELNPNPRYNSQ